MGKYREVPYPAPTVSLLCECGTFVTTDETIIDIDT